MLAWKPPARTGMRLSLFLYQAGHRVSIVNPARIVAFRKSEGGRTKTDKQDAKLIAHFCAQKQPVAWVPTPKEMDQLQVLLMRLESLQQMERQEANRLENSRLYCFMMKMICYYAIRLGH